MGNPFFEHPILNSPYAYPSRHWKLDGNGQPTQQITEERRPADFVTPIPKPNRQHGQGNLDLGDDTGLSTGSQQYAQAAIIRQVREQVDRWRQLPESQWHVTPETARLLKWWRHHPFSGIRPFFCQVEAAETAIWLTEVAPEVGREGRAILDHLARANHDANPELMRLALKLATGAGKTTVMAMLIAWQTVNAIRRPSSRRFSRGFLVVCPGITIRDRLRVLQPNDPNSYYKDRELVPPDMLGDIGKAAIVITNYHAFMLRERLQISAGGRRLLEGRHGDEKLQTLETEGQMIQRVMPSLMGMKNILVINDEAHHCYREKPADDDDFLDNEGKPLKGPALTEARNAAKQENDAARVWISGLEAVNRTLRVARVMDLSATPFFLSGSGYAEGTLFPWVMSDFSLMDAIECGIVKLPRVPVSDNIPGNEMPVYRDLWHHIRMPKKGRGKAGALNPLDLPVLLQTALEALYGHYAKTFEAWQKAGIQVPPCFIVVCQNTAVSKLVYDYIAGFERTRDDGTVSLESGRLPLFRNFDDYNSPIPRPHTLLIDSQQLESGDALDKNFREAVSDELERYKREVVERANDPHAADTLTDQDLLREVMNTVGKAGRLGESVRCVVSVSMLTEGWDANTVTHVLGVRAFGTQLLCEQVVGRALRRQSYELNSEGLFNVEYADVLGVPFDFTAQAVNVSPVEPRETVHVQAMHPERDALEIRFPRVAGYRVELPQTRLRATFDENSVLKLTPEIVGPARVHVSGIIGEGVDLNLEHLADERQSTVLFHLTKHLLETRWRNSDGEPQLNLFGQLKRIAREWLDTCLVCQGGTYPQQLIYRQLADMACDRITAGITRAHLGENEIRAVLDAYNPQGSTAHVNFNTTRTERWRTAPDKCHVNYVILDSGWEGEFCRIAEGHPRVITYVKNRSMGFEVPYRHGGENRTYIPDYIVQVDDGHGLDDPLNLVVEIKGYRGEDAKEKATTMKTYWVPGVNHLGTQGRWAFAEFTDVWGMEEDFAKVVEAGFHTLVQEAVQHEAAHQLALLGGSASDAEAAPRRRSAFGEDREVNRDNG
ncbi:MAG TPA: DEAD/DEAH box helicase family protein [Nevskiaceae bacterium]|nr:DEAD/DEAH box helicase family protein [Nevskiaceae bacterium]